MDLDYGWLAALSAALLATGVVGGLLAGLLGVGGGIVIVPVLFQMFSFLDIDPSVRMHLAVGTSLATIIPTSIVSARAHYGRGAVDIDLLKSWGSAILVGVLIGTTIGGYVKGQVLTGVFAVVALAVAANMAFRPEGSTVSDHLPGGVWKHAIGGVIGVFSAMMGIGGGTLSVPILGAFSYPIRRAVGTAAAIGLIIGVPGAAGFVFAGLDVPARPPGSLGYVNLIGFALIVPTSMVAAPFGAKIAHTINPGLLRKAFALFLFLTSLRMIYGLVT
jgi:uncharacterized protein